MSDYRRHDVIREDRADGSILLRSGLTMGPVAARTTDWLERWAYATPDAVFLAERAGTGWRTLTYGAARDEARALAAGLLGLGLDATTPILIVSGNSIDHGLLALAAQYVGVPFVPLAEQYALIPAARVQIDAVAARVRPGAVFAEDGERLRDVLDRDVFEHVCTLVSRGAAPGDLTLADLARTGGEIATAVDGVGPDTVAKILMTSGSTSAPKGVPTTHRMMCTNQAQIGAALPFLAKRPPLIVDWLPWNHVFGGSHNVNMMLANGGALYIDDGKPTPALVGRTLENLGMQTGTLTFNVPLGFAMVRDALRGDAELRRRYFAELDLLFYAGASLPQDVWADLEAMAREVRGDMPLFTSSWGLTETAPAHLLQHEPTHDTGMGSGVVGVPLPDTETKLVPFADGRFEIRVRGPNVFDGYLDQPEDTDAAFDDEGFFVTGDAMAFVDANDPSLGLRFDGRLAEDFKLLSGTWVRAANVRLDVLSRLAELAADVVVTGADRHEIGVLIVPSQAVRDAPDASEDDGALRVASITDALVSRLAHIGGSGSTRIARVLILSEPPSIGDGEMTAKGSLNVRTLLSRRAALLARLYDDADPATVLVHSSATP